MNNPLRSVREWWQQRHGAGRIDGAPERDEAEAAAQAAARRSFRARQDALADVQREIDRALLRGRVRVEGPPSGGNL